MKNKTNTWWDNQDYGAIKHTFLRDSENGIDHPSREFIRKWLSAHPGLKLLDIPCGPGVEYEGFEKYQTPVLYFGMDSSNSIIRAFRELFPKAKVKKGDICNIPLPENSLDVVLCRHILEHLPDYKVAISEAVRVSRKWIFLILFRVPNKKEHRQIGWGAWDNRLDIRELKKYLETLPVEIKIKTIPNNHPSSLEENTIIELKKKPITNLTNIIRTIQANCRLRWLKNY